MEVIDVKKMFENNIEKNKMDLISENLRNYVSMSFYGNRNTINSSYVDFDLYFFPLVEALNERDIFTDNNKTCYGEIEINHTTFYICNLDNIKKNCNFIDVFGYISSFKNCGNFTLALGDANLNVKISYYSENIKFYGCGFIFLGRFARINELNWKFHPIFKQIYDGYPTLEKDYLHGKFKDFRK